MEYLKDLINEYSAKYSIVSYAAGSTPKAGSPALLIEEFEKRVARTLVAVDTKIKKKVKHKDGSITLWTTNGNFRFWP